ncbi:homoserine kinase [Buchnera aphidicola]|uniref:homoserine kinase n=1 Tax=Buchnera aphidicola TaxID=9 RepID=UPI0020928DAF|nr:homoserine kinase [Buchnera aphidicola]USS94266.1 homoserine kinase [Buchnera aphidicola (Sipha maydis)]
MIKIYAPASIGNLGVGFDILGAAITPINNKILGDIITIQSSHQFQLTNIGKYAQEIPQYNKKNIVWKACKLFFEKIQKKNKIHIILEKNLPISSGLGSSASSIVSTLVALNIFFNYPLKKKKLLQMMGSLEGEISGEKHYDNVAPSYLGGIQLILNTKKNISNSIPYFKKWFWIIAWPGIKLSTSQSRSILPKLYKRKTCIQYGKNISQFLYSSYTNQSDLAISSMKDVIAEPFRKNLIQGFLKHKKNLKKIGSLAYGISGSGPTLFSITENKNIAKKIQKYFLENYIQEKNGFSYICTIDSFGAREVK